MKRLLLERRPRAGGSGPTTSRRRRRRRGRGGPTSGGVARGTADGELERYAYRRSGAGGGLGLGAPRASFRPPPHPRLVVNNSVSSNWFSRFVNLSGIARLVRTGAGIVGALTGSGQGDRFSFGRVVAGRYRIEELVGRGGMGEVFRAYDERLKMPVALKTLPAHLATDPIRRGLFEREITAQARATHPYVAQVLEIAEDAGQLFLVMEFIEGQPLSALLRNARPSVADVQEWGRQIAQALAAIHERGLLHCDLKPGNVMITPQGIVKVTDFGIAQLPRGLDGARVRAEVPPPDAGTPALPTPAHAPEDADGDTNATHGTIGDSRVPGAEEIDTLSMLQRPRSNAGTPAYMSPEQHDGLDVDGRTDLFSLGIVLWECVTGRHPFYRERIDAVREAICTEPPANLNAREWRGHTNLRRLVLRLLEKDPARRFATAAEVADALEKLREPWPLWLRASVAAGVVAVVAVSSIAAGWPDRHPYWPPSHWLERDWPPPTRAEGDLLSNLARLRRASQSEAGLAALQAFTGQNPKSLHAQVELVNLLLEHGSQNRARDAADTAVYLIQDAGYRANDLPLLDVLLLRAVARSRPADQIDIALRVLRHWSSKRPLARQQLARGYVNAGRFKDAKDVLTTITTTQPDDARSRLTLAQVYADLNEIQRAETELATAAAIARRDANSDLDGLLAWTRGYVEYRRPDYSQAALNFDHAEALYRKAGLALDANLSAKLLADALVHRGDPATNDYARANRLYATAAEHFEALGYFQLWVETLNARGALLRMQGSQEAESQLRRAVDEARKLDDETVRVQPLSMLANMALEQGRLDEAGALAREIIDITNRHEDRQMRNNALFVMAGISAKRGEFAASARILNSIIDREKANDGRTEDFAYARASMLELEHAAERPAAALEQAREAEALLRLIDDRGTLACMLALRARVLTEMGDLDPATRDVMECQRNTVALDSSVAIYCDVAAAELDLQRRDFSAAHARAAEILKSAPLAAADEEVAVRIVLARAKKGEGDNRGAIASAERAVNVERASRPWNDRARVTLAEILLGTGNTKDAAIQARNAISQSHDMGMRLSEVRARTVALHCGDPDDHESRRAAWVAYVAGVPPEYRDRVKLRQPH